MAAPEKYGGGGVNTFGMSVILEEMLQHRMGLYNPGCGVFGRSSASDLRRCGGANSVSTRSQPYGGARTRSSSPSQSPVEAQTCRFHSMSCGPRMEYFGAGTARKFSFRMHMKPTGEWSSSGPISPRVGKALVASSSTRMPGFTARPFRTIRTVSLPNEVSFEDCQVPAANMIGKEGDGLDLCMDLLTKQRFPYSACNLGVAIAAHRLAVAHAKQRSTFGVPLSQRQAIQWMLADAEVELRATRYLIWDGAWKADRGEDARVEASIASLFSEMLGRVIDNAVQIHGGYGVTKEFPLERWYREARVRRIGEGPSEVHRMVIARALFR